MRYCLKCRNVFEGERCPVCGSKKSREPAADDLCFLTEEGPLLGGMLEDVLKQNGIPVLSESSKGAALSVITSSLFEWIKYYVRYDHLPQAREIVEEVLHSSEAASEEEPEQEELEEKMKETEAGEEPEPED